MIYKCDKCGKELKWYQVKRKSFDGGRKYCVDCFKLTSFSNRDKILQTLKIQESKRQADLELSGKPPKKEDLKRRKKIKEIEKELMPTKITSVGVGAGSIFIMVGFILFAIAFVCFLTIILAPVGVLVLLAGVVSIIIGFIVGGVGAISGGISSIKNKSKK